MSRPAQPPRADHQRTADEARRRPGTWVTVSEYRNPVTVRNIAQRIRTGYPIGGTADRRPYAPAGHFETRTTLTEDGTLLETRYTGAPAASPGEGAV
jgi:hypothetical protein